LGPRDGLEEVTKKKMPSLRCRESNSVRPVRSLFSIYIQVQNRRHVTLMRLLVHYAFYRTGSGGADEMILIMLMVSKQHPDCYFYYISLVISLILALLSQLIKCHFQSGSSSTDVILVIG
jgi:hypothetical protein